jgi:outer membrane protein OmpA-like peptidoglycan-associated protein
MKGCNKEDAKNTATSGAVVNAADTAIAAASSAATAVAGSVDSFGNWVADLGSDKTFKLTDGTEMKVGENSTEYKLFNFITNPEMKVDTVNKSANWYSFNRVYFQTGKSILTAESQTQVKNIALILKNYPNAKIKMGGYTDNTGNADVNKRISDERAKIVAKELVKLGAGKDQVVEAVGYGAEFPIASNDTPEGKAQNRRVDLKVATK